MYCGQRLYGLTKTFLFYIGAQISGRCQAHMKDVQEELMEDYSINPAVVAHCDIEIRNYCGRVEKGGKTLDCLMEKAMEKEEPKSQVKFSKECYDAVSIEFSIGDFPRVARA